MREDADLRRIKANLGEDGKENEDIRPKLFFTEGDKTFVRLDSGSVTQQKIIELSAKQRGPQVLEENKIYAITANGAEQATIVDARTIKRTPSQSSVSTVKKM